MKATRLLPLFVLVGAGAFAACSSSSTDPATTGGAATGDVKLAEHVTIVEGALADAVADLLAGAEVLGDAPQPVDEAQV